MIVRNDRTGARKGPRKCGMSWTKVVARLSLCAALLSFLGAFIEGSHDPCFAAQRRSALVVGNAGYAREPLPNAVNDARAIGSALRAHGFEVVVVEDAGSETMRSAVAGFGKRLEAGGLGLFYYSGHGLQIEGSDHLVPVNADIASEASLRLEAIRLEDIIGEMSKPRPDRMNVLILDACRNAPFGGRFGGAASDDGRRRPFPPDLLIAHATEPGSIAFDTGSGHGLYTWELLNVITATGGMRSMDVFDRIAAAVSARTGKAQVPQATASLARGFGFAGYADRASSLEVSLDGPGEVRLTTLRGIRSSGQNPDVALWESIKNSRNAADYEAYLKAFPNGQFATDARARADKYRRPVQQKAPAPQQKAPAPQQKAPAPQIEDLDAYVTLGADSNVRAEPKTTSKRVVSAAAGTQLHVTGKVKGTNWYRVEAEPGVSGFVYGDLAAQAPGAEPAPTQPPAPRVAGATWELLTPFASDSFETRNLEQFVSEIDDATNGGFKIVVLSAPSMRGADIEQAVAAGRASAGEFLISDLGGRNAAFEADLVPFLATTYDEALALWDASRPVLQPLLEADGLHLAFVVAHPPRGMFADKELWKMSDLRGLRVLDDHPMTAKLAALVGAVPAERPPGTLAEAFAANRIDAMIASIPAGVAEKAWTFVPDYYDLRVSLPKSVVTFNRAAYAALDPEIQRAVLNASVAAQNRGWSTSAAANNDGIDLLRSKGMTVAAPPREIADSLKQIGASMARDWAQRAGNDGQAILGQYQRAQLHVEQ
jgi:uncharacterized caspase-like protein/TRAP-type C4-dicarboxylate transport system substrate-binding protein